MKFVQISSQLSEPETRCITRLKDPCPFRGGRGPQSPVSTYRSTYQDADTTEYMPIRVGKEQSLEYMCIGTSGKRHETWEGQVLNFASPRRGDGTKGSFLRAVPR